MIQEERPKYRPLAKYHSDKFDSISSKLSEDKLDLELYKLDKEVGWELKQKAEEIIASKLSENLNDYSNFFEEFGEYGKAQLADYIAHRHQILRLLNVSLSQNDDGIYAPETAIHNLIFPMGQTSDDIGPDEHNLWIIDEKLSYHYYLASDKKIKNLEVLDSEVGREPDLIVFNRPFAIVSEPDPPYQSIVIFEFKKPMRDNYREGTTEIYKDNPIEQVNRYIIDILEGGTKDNKGRPFQVKEGTPFYCYIVADITPSLISIIEGAGFYSYPRRLRIFFL